MSLQPQSQQKPVLIPFNNSFLSTFASAYPTWVHVCRFRQVGPLLMCERWVLPTHTSYMLSCCTVCENTCLVTPSHEVKTLYHIHSWSEDNICTSFKTSGALVVMS
jgi:hypothetical protein